MNQPGSNVVVTGGAGFLGSHVVDVLVDRGHRVTVFDTHESSFEREGVEYVTGDIQDTEAVRAACEGASAVFHLAALADLNAAKTRPRDTVEINIGGTINVLEAVREFGIQRLMFASTVYVYSREGGFYRCSKQACEGYIEEYRQKYGVEYTVLRYGSLYGPRSDASNGVYRLIHGAMTEGRVRHGGGPEDVREYIHVQDAARLSVDALADGFANERIVITGNDALRFRDLITMLSEILGSDVAVEYPDAASGARSGHYSMTPYAFEPKLGRKLTTPHYVDMGQGLLQVMQEIHAVSSKATQ